MRKYQEHRDPSEVGQDNQESIFDNSGIKIGAGIGSAGDTVTMKDVEERPGGGKDGIGSRRKRPRAIAMAGDAPPWIHSLHAEMKQMFSNWMINVTQ